MLLYLFLQRYPKARGDTARKIGGDMLPAFQNPKPVYDDQICDFP